MKNTILLVIFLFLSFFINAQTTGEIEVKHLKVTGEIRPKSEVLNLNPDLVITQDSTNKETTYSGITEVEVIPSFQSLADSLSLNAKFDSILVAEKVVLDTVNTPYREGAVFYGKDTKALTVYNDIPDFSHQLGYELTKRVYNNTGATIPDGRFVRRTGTHQNNIKIATIALAGNSTPDSASVFGITTVEILDNSYGEITIIGDVNNLDLASLNEDAFYLGHAGLPIDTAPPPPYFSVCGGEVIYADNDSGILAVNINLPTLTPSPLIAMDTSDINQIVTISTIDVYEYIPIGLVNVLEENFGFTTDGDSIQTGVSGYYQIVLSSSFQGNPTSETWNYGVFINGELEHKKTRTTSSSAAGDINVPISRRLNIDDWISFKIRNTSGNGDPTVVDLAYQILFLHE